MQGKPKCGRYPQDSGIIDTAAIPPDTSGRDSLNPFRSRTPRSPRVLPAHLLDVPAKDNPRSQTSSSQDSIADTTPSQATHRHPHLLSQEQGGAREYERRSSRILHSWRCWRESLMLRICYLMSRASRNLATLSRRGVGTIRYDRGGIRR